MTLRFDNRNKNFVRADGYVRIRIRIPIVALCVSHGPEFDPFSRIYCAIYVNISSFLHATFVSDHTELCLMSGLGPGPQKHTTHRTLLPLVQQSKTLGADHRHF